MLLNYTIIMISSGISWLRDGGKPYFRRHISTSMTWEKIAHCSHLLHFAKTRLRWFKFFPPKSAVIMEASQKAALLFLVIATIVCCLIVPSSGNHRRRYNYPSYNTGTSSRSTPSIFCNNGQCYYLQSVPSYSSGYNYNSLPYGRNSEFYRYPGVTLNTVSSTSSTTNAGLNGCVANGIICFNSGRKKWNILARITGTIQDFRETIQNQIPVALVAPHISLSYSAMRIMTMYNTVYGRRP